MATHTIMFPDIVVGRAPRSIVWDDEAGTVEGEHSRLDVIREAFAEPTPYEFGTESHYWRLEDPAHNPADLLTVLSVLIDWQAFDDPRLVLPPVFDGVEATPGIAIPCPPGARH